MTKNFIKLFLPTIVFVSFNSNSVVDDLTGDSGGAQTGSVTLSGGTSGAVFTGAASKITQSLNYISLPVTTSTNGQILVDGVTVFHIYGAAQNVFSGESAGNFTMTGGENSGYGAFVLNSNTSGTQNSGFGDGALMNNTSGGGNTAAGVGAGSGLTSGSNHTLIGGGAGAAYTTEAGNIIVGQNSGNAGDNQVIRIGSGGGMNACYVDGIFGSDVDLDTALTVLVDDTGKLGTTTSLSGLLKGIQNIEAQSSPIMNLHPILYFSPKKIKHYGLLLHEVNKVMPELVIKNKKGQPLAIRYNELPVLLLNELKKQAIQIKKLENDLQNLNSRLHKLEAK